MAMNKQFLINFPIHLGSYQDFTENILKLAESRASSYICVANVHQLVEAYLDNSFLPVPQKADIVVPDGMPLTWALKIMYNIQQQRIAGMDLLPDLLRKAEKRKLSVYFYGGTQEVLNETCSYIKKNFQNLNLAGCYSPPFRCLTPEEESEVACMINNSEAHLVFVVLGCPKQEKWMASMKHKINATMIGIGGALPVMIGKQQRAPVWVQNIGMEWFYRLAQEPERLWKRYLITNSVFIYLFLKAKLNMEIVNLRKAYST